MRPFPLMIYRVCFAMLPVTEQRRIAANLEIFRDETERLESLYQRKLTALDELKKSLLAVDFARWVGMERLQFVNPERIEWCCVERGITPAEMAAQLGIKPESLTMLLAGEGGITFPQLRRVAAFLDRRILFLLEWEPVRESAIAAHPFA